MYHSRHSHKVDIPNAVGRCLLGLMVLEQKLVQHNPNRSVQELEPDSSPCSSCKGVGLDQCLNCQQLFLTDATFGQGFPQKELQLVF